MTDAKLKLIFMGTPDFSVTALAALIDAGHDIVAVYSQPPRPAGRGKKDRPSPVQASAEARGIPVRTPLNFKDQADVQAFRDLDADACVVVAYGLILPQVILDAPKSGCFNIHASLLPRWRGAAPIQRAILAGDEQTGVCIMQMEAGLDTGPVVLREHLAMAPDMNAENLHDGLSALGASMIVRAMADIDALLAEPQSADGVTYAAKIDKSETRIDWTRSAIDVARHIRGLYPMAWFEFEGQRVRVLAANVEDGAGAPGQVLDDQLLVACGEDALRLKILQRAGKGAMEADALLRGFVIAQGASLA